MNSVARLLFPSLRWRDSTGFEHESEKIERTLAFGVGGYIVFQGDADAVADLSQRLQSGSNHPLLIAADLERGAGQQFRGLNQLPPPAALGFVNRTDVTRRCGAITAAEAAEVGVNWIYAPIADLDSEPNNPIVQTRSFGDDPRSVGEHVAAWVRAVEESGVAACAKHYPGHGRTAVDSHDVLPTVAGTLDSLRLSDLAPFAEGVGAGVSSVMTAHVAFPDWDPGGLPATLSQLILGYLRTELGFRGVVVTDALIMEGALRGGSEAAAAVAAVAAGCDALLYPRSTEAVLAGLENSTGDALLVSRIDDALERIDGLAGSVGTTAVTPVDLGENQRFAAAVADISLHVLRGDAVVVDEPIEIKIIDDDVGGPYRVGDRGVFEASLRESGVMVSAGATRVVLVYCEPRSSKGRAGLGPRSLRRLEELVAGAHLVMLFGHPRIGPSIPGDVPVVCCWHGQPLMQEAAARWVLGRLGM